MSVVLPMRRRPLMLAKNHLTPREDLPHLFEFVLTPVEPPVSHDVGV
jgi:hypothetical protein